MKQVPNKKAPAPTKTQDAYLTHYTSDYLPSRPRGKALMNAVRSRASCLLQGENHDAHDMKSNGERSSEDVRIARMMISLPKHGGAK